MPRKAVYGQIAIPLLACLLAWTEPAAAPPPAAAGCADCHGQDGISIDTDIPSIAGMSAFYLEEQLRAYRETGVRPCATVEYKRGAHPKGAKDDMCAIAKRLTETEIAEIAAWFAKQPFKPANQPFDAAKAAVGAKLHAQRCEKCHSNGGSEPLDDAGILAGQWRGYLENTLREQRSGKRVMDEKMAPRVRELTEQEVQALIEFYVSGGKP